MITRSNLVEQLRDYQIRSQQKWATLTIFSPKPQLVTRSDVIVAFLLVLLFSMLVTSSCLALYFRCFRLSIVIKCLGILLLICLKISRKRILARKRERRLLLPLSM